MLFSLSQSLAGFLLPIPASLSSAALEILVPRGHVLPARGTIIVPLNWKIRLELTPCVNVCMLSHVQLFVTPWTAVARQAPLSMEFPRQEFWGGFLSPTPDLPDPGIKPVSPASPALQEDSLPLSHRESLLLTPYATMTHLPEYWK